MLPRAFDPKSRSHQWHRTRATRPSYPWTTTEVVFGRVVGPMERSDGHKSTFDCFFFLVWREPPWMIRGSRASGIVGVDVGPEHERWERRRETREPQQWGARTVKWREVVERTKSGLEIQAYLCAKYLTMQKMPKKPGWTVGSRVGQCRQNSSKW